MEQLSRKQKTLSIITPIGHLLGFFILYAVIAFSVERNMYVFLMSVSWILILLSSASAIYLNLVLDKVLKDPFPFAIYERWEISSKEEYEAIVELLKKIEAKEDSQENEQIHFK